MVKQIKEHRKVYLDIGKFIALIRNRLIPSLENLSKNSFNEIVEIVYERSYLVRSSSKFIRENSSDPLAITIGVKGVEHGGYSDDNLYQMLLGAVESGESLKFLKLAGPTDFRQNIICSTNKNHKPIKGHKGYDYYSLLTDSRIPEIKFILVDPFCESFLTKLDAEGDGTWDIAETNKKNVEFAAGLVHLAEVRDISLDENETLRIGFHKEDLIWNICIFGDQKVLLKSYGLKGKVRGHVDKNNKDKSKVTNKEVILETNADALIAESFLTYFNSISSRSKWLGGIDKFNEYMSTRKYPSLYRGNAILKRDTSFLKSCMLESAKQAELKVLQQQGNGKYFRTPDLLREEKTEWFGDVPCMESIHGCNMFDVFHRLHILGESSSGKHEKIAWLLGYLFSHSYESLKEYRTTVPTMDRTCYLYDEKMLIGLKEVLPYLSGIRSDLLKEIFDDIKTVGNEANKQKKSVFRDGHIKNRLIRFSPDSDWEAGTSELLVNELVSMSEEEAREYLDRNIVDVDFECSNLEVSIWDDLAHLFTFENVGLFRVDNIEYKNGASIDCDENISKFVSLGKQLVSTVESFTGILVGQNDILGFWMTILSRSLREMCRRIWYANVMPCTYEKRYGLEGRDYYIKLALVCSFQISGIPKLKKLLVECLTQGDSIWGGIPYRPSVTCVKPTLIAK